MNNQLFIPEELKVGYNKRSDTYTSNLGFVIYKDSKEQWRQAKAWEDWRSKDIDPKEFKNVPTEGFVVNRDVGGVRRSYSSWHGRMEKIRVFDPRDFEIEITVENLLYILQEANSIKGKGLDGQFVYAWQAKQLVLLPVTAQEYESSNKFTALQSGKVSAKSLVVGGTYQTKSQQNIVYLGKLRWHSWNYLGKKKLRELGLDEKTNSYTRGSDTSKQFIFASKDGKAFPEANVSKLAGMVSETPVTNYAELVDQFNQRIESDKVVGLEMGSPSTIKIIKEKYSYNDNFNHKLNDQRNNFFEKIDDKTYVSYCFTLSTEKYDATLRQYTEFSITYYKYHIIKFGDDGELYELSLPESERGGYLVDDRYSYYKRYEYPKTKKYNEAGLSELENEINALQLHDLIVVMESGAKYTLSEYYKNLRGY
jgi:hypothetical protein